MKLRLLTQVPTFRRFTGLCALSLAFAAAGVQAQEAPDTSAPPPASTAPAQQEVETVGPTLKVTANLVDVYFSARDKTGFITGLTKNDCQLAEAHNPETIKNFTQEKKLPITIGLLLDTSGSQQNVLPLEQDSGAQFLRDVLQPKDEAFLISFDVNVDLLADYTNRASELKRALDKATINAASSSAGIPGIGGGPNPVSRPRGTLLYDAVYLAAHDKLRPEAGRKVIVMLTDGGDQGSQETLNSAIDAAQKANVIVYVILIADRANFGYDFNADAAMQKLAGDTGGRVINVGNNGKRLEAAFQAISDELRTQYLLSYTPDHPADGKYYKLELECGKGVKIDARKGYYALAGDAAND